MKPYSSIRPEGLTDTAWKVLNDLGRICYYNNTHTYEKRFFDKLGIPRSELEEAFQLLESKKYVFWEHPGEDDEFLYELPDAMDFVTSY